MSKLAKTITIHGERDFSQSYKYVMESVSRQLRAEGKLTDGVNLPLVNSIDELTEEEFVAQCGVSKFDIQNTRSWMDFKDYECLMENKANKRLDKALKHCTDGFDDLYENRVFISENRVDVVFPSNCAPISYDVDGTMWKDHSQRMLRIACFLKTEKVGKDIILTITPSLSEPWISNAKHHYLNLEAVLNGKAVNFLLRAHISPDEFAERIDGLTDTLAGHIIENLLDDNLAVTWNGQKMTLHNHFSYSTESVLYDLFSPFSEERYQAYVDSISPENVFILNDMHRRSDDYVVTYATLTDCNGNTETYDLNRFLCFDDVAYAVYDTYRSIGPKALLVRPSEYEYIFGKSPPQTQPKP